MVIIITKKLDRGTPSEVMDFYVPKGVLGKTFIIITL